MEGMRLTAAAALFVSVCLAQTHPTPMAGRWFPAEKTDLNRLLDSSYAASARRSPGPPRSQLRGLVVPHAGLQYSGVVAASSYRLIGKPANVILLGFPHRYPFQGIASPRVEAYSTSLGEVKVNRTALAELGFPERDEKALCDHSLENQLPFLQRSVPDALLIPLYVGTLDSRELQVASRKLAARVREGDVIVASSDFTHYGESYGYVPFAKDAKLAERLRSRAKDSFERIGSLDVPFLDAFLRDTGDTICGRDPIRLLMATLAAVSPDIYMSVVDSMASGDLVGDYSTSVTYGALAFYPSSAFAVDAGGRTQLLAHARGTLDHHLGINGVALPELLGSAELDQRSGVFVTIRKQGELRGCIGVLSPERSLPATVADRTLMAARSDPRFAPLTAAEGPVTLEISLLSPLKLLPDWRAYRSGLGGALMLGERAGLLLPQVAREMKWTPEQFLMGLSQKAGLDPKAYRDPKARLYVFSAQVFGE
jgi:AmmeMemoRadiSam system protein B/AmmeMemoRadiSam system protein A